MPIARYDYREGVVVAVCCLNKCSNKRQRIIIMEIV